jgi:hypothetical protein
MRKTVAKDKGCTEIVCTNKKVNGMEINWLKEMERLEKWSPSEGKHIVVFRSNGEKYEFKDEDTKRERTRIRFEVEVEGIEELRNWWINKSPHEKSAYQQVGKIAMDHDGNLRGVKVEVTAVGEKRDRLYTLKDIGTVFDRKEDKSQEKPEYEADEEFIEEDDKE